MNRVFSWQRFIAMVLKEFVQMKRDRYTFAMMIGIPLIQLILFGFAINFDPKHLPTVVVDADNSAFTRDVLVSLQNSGYFHILPGSWSEKQANTLLARGKVQFAISIPPLFSSRLVRGQKPQILVEVDATDPAASSFALNVVENLDTVFNQQYTGLLSDLKSDPPAIDFVVHAKYNPERITQYNIVPGLLGVVLTMTMVVITSLAIAREKERGTMEHLLAMPFTRSEVMLGKIVPYIVVGYIQVSLILIVAHFLFKIPFEGSLALLNFACLLFIMTNLAVGLLFSTITSNQLQAMQLAFFFFLPSILLSGFMFPFRGMPAWAQAIGNIFPLTHFLPIVRGILLKGNGFMDVYPHIINFMIFWLIVTVLGIQRYHQTLD